MFVLGLLKKYGVANYSYFENGEIQQCNIFATWQMQLSSSCMGCFKSICHVKSCLQKEWWVNWDLDDKICSCWNLSLYHLVPLDPSCFLRSSLLLLFDVWSWNTQLDKSCIYYVWILLCVTILKTMIICHTILFLRHPVY